MALNQKEQAKLRRIRKMVSRTHWTQRAYQDWSEDGDKPLYCLVGFVNHVVDFDPEIESAEDDAEILDWGADPSKVKMRRRLLRAIEEGIVRHTKRKSKPGHLFIEQFNDKKKTTRDDILAVLDAALEAEV